MELAQLNIARLAAPLESPALADFVANLDRINALAEASAGFVWRFEEPAGRAPQATHAFGGEFIVNLSVWRTIEHLHDYVYRSAHAPIMARRRDWFERMDEAHTVLWWIPDAHRPTPTEAAKRLACLRERGPSAEAFTFKHSFPAQDDTNTDDARQGHCTR